MPRPSIAPPLTGREVEMLNWIMAGKTDWEIATILHLSKKTVNYHVENAKKKLGSAHRITAVAVALRDGLIPFPLQTSFAKRASSLDHAPSDDQAASPRTDFDTDFDTDTDNALPWAVASWHMPDDSGAGPCPAVLLTH